MKPLEKQEIFENLSGFLKTKGIELKDGSYVQGIEKGCHLLTEAINIGQQGFDCAKTKIDKKLDQMRQVIHEKTAPKSPVAATAPEPPPTQAQTAPPKAAPSKPKTAKSPKTKKTRK